MANIRKWIAEARELEESGDLQGALAVYRKALVAQEETSGFADLSLYNGLGDLFLRAGDTQAAIDAYESAAAQCEEQQLFANGIALCKKILRNAPDHTPVYRRVGRLFALSGLDAEAAANYREYATRVTASGRPELALEALREMVELTADEEAAVGLADQLAERNMVNDALTMLRTARERRERHGRDFVTLLRKIQELQPFATPEGDPPAETPAALVAAAPPAPAARSAESRPSVMTPIAPVASATPATPPEPTLALDAADTGALTRELHRVLSQVDGDDRFRHALPLIDHLLQLQPGRFELLHRKLAYAFALGEEGLAISAYLALGECLDRQLASFTLRTLSTSTQSGAVTAAVKVESSPDVVPGAQGG
jgi:tetratricopeptide (TPR) repeat protein